MGKRETVGAPKFEDTEEIVSGAPSFEETLPVDEKDTLKKKESTPSILSSPSANTTSESTTGALGSQGLPAINEGINPPGILTKASNPLEPKITVETQGLSAATAPSYATTREVNAPGSVSTLDVEKGAEAVAKNEKVASFMKGTAALGASLARTPAFLSDLTNRTINTINPIPQVTGYLPANAHEIKNPVAEGLEKTAADIGKEVNKDNLDAEGNVISATDHFSKGEYGKGFNSMFNSVAESMPVTISLMAGNAAGVSAPALATGVTPVFAAGEKQALKENHPEMTDEQMNNVSALSGALESVTESMFGNVKLGAVYKDLFAKQGAEVAKKTIGEGVKSVYEKALKPYIGNVSEEMASEMSNQYLDNLNHIYIGGNTEVKPFDGVMEAGLVAIGSAGTLGAPTIGINIARHKADVKKAQAIKEQQDAIKAEMANPLVTPETKKTLVKELEGLNAEEDAHVKEMTDKHEKLPDDKKKEVDDILKKNGEIASAALDPNISKEGREAMTSQIDKNDKAVEDIYKENEKLLKEQDKEKEKHEEAGLTDHKAENYSKETDDLLKEIEEEETKNKEDAIQKQSASSVLQHTQEGASKTRSERSGVEQGEQGKETAAESNTEKEKVEPDLIVTHAPTKETEANITSSVSNEPLSDKGEKIAEKIGAQAKEEGVETIVTDKETARNKETAQIAAKESGSKVEEKKGLHTWDKGDFEGLDSKDWKSSEKYFLDHPDQTEHNGKKLKESFNEFKERYLAAKEAALKEPGKKLFVGSSTGIRLEQAIEAANGEWTKKAKEHFLSNEIDHEGNVEENPNQDLRASEVTDKLDKDIEAFKVTDPKNLVKKFVGVNSRIDKMVEDKLIGKREAKAYKKTFQQIYDQKVNNIKEGVTKVAEDLKKSILGQYKGKAFSSILPVTPQMIADLIDVATKLTHKYIDLNYSTQEAIQKALEKIKKHSLYQKLQKAGVLNEKDFEKEVSKNFGEAKEEPIQEAKANESDIGGEKKKRSIGKRILQQDKLKAVSERLKKKGIDYTSISQKKATGVANQLIEEAEKQNALIDLADSIIDGGTDIPYSIQGLVAAKLTDRLNVIAENEKNDFTKQATFDKSAELAMWWAEEATKAGQFNGVASAEIASSLPSSKEGLRTFANKELEKLHDKLLTKEEKKQIEATTKEINDLMSEDDMSEKDLAILDKLVNKKIAEISESINGKEYVTNMKTILGSLKMDLSEC